MVTHTLNWLAFRLPVRGGSEGQPPADPDVDAVTGLPPSAGRRGSPSRHRRGWIALAAVAVIADIAALGIVLGSPPGGGPEARASAIDVLGRPFDDPACAKSPLASGAGFGVACATWAATVSPSLNVTTVSLYAGGSDGFAEYTGPLPKALRWREPLHEVASSLGRPSRISAAYGPPMMVYTFTGEPYGSLELRFDGAATLVGISASLTR